MNFKKPTSKKLYEAVLFVKQNWRKVIFYAIVSISACISPIYATLRAINSPLSYNPFFKNYFFAVLIAGATWLAMRTSSALAVFNAEKARTRANYLNEQVKTLSIDLERIQNDNTQLHSHNTYLQQAFSQSQSKLRKEEVQNLVLNTRNSYLQDELIKRIKHLEELQKEPEKHPKVVRVKTSFKPSSANTEVTNPPDQDYSDIDSVLDMFQK